LTNVRNESKGADFWPAKIVLHNSESLFGFLYKHTMCEIGLNMWKRGKWGKDKGERGQGRDRIKKIRKRF